MVITSRFADVTVPDVDLWSLYMETPRAYPDNHPILIDGDTSISYTRAQIKEYSIALGQGLKHTFSWSKGDVLAFYTPNDIDTAIVNLGLHWAGGIGSPANPTYTVDELARQMQDSGAKAIITQTPFLETVLAAARQVGLPKDRVLLLGRQTQQGFRHWRDINADGAWMKPRRTRVNPETDLAYLVYSSGTTGLPKGVALTHRNIVANSSQGAVLDLKGLSWDFDAHLGVLPFFHIYGLSVVLNVTLITGAPCVVMPKWDLEKACALIQKHRLTFLYVPPPIVLALGKQPVVDKYDLSTLRWINSGAAPCGRELVVAVWERLKVGVKQGYGLSETSPTITTQFADEWFRFQGSVGKLLPGMKAKIVDEAGKEVPQGESGELLVKGDNVFSGYWNRPDLQEGTFDEDGWFKTGDVFKVDDKGNFYITDRIKELIKYKGFQVAPAELEEKLHGHPKVGDVCVIGVFNEEEHTEVPRAYIVPKPGVAPSDELAEEIASWLAGRVAPPKKLRGGVRFLDEIPKSQSGKILRRVVAQMVKKEDGAVKAKL
ncbi:Acyl-CoA synthetase (AMP-forming)/AMP-acid ligase II [Emericellopsis cladophorae]|uniref:Acyl-CoA synthetase (AMP-forming)/AMP-acid ligase II n=1 Tax=Emericellopsis cladophorae TaxID=2686198 RepID=A0A9Q0BBE1_9HYPO|nr:Acyl-CoA synthetase (AMP-forming)/AMP-acid ligase II [Emericellopsis cladophorae]KAI6779717.1 Acyl-CoA synthetase (AMP-forming)/AMP-acid ligase II [Emericellopsis cladophorae]